MRAGRQAGKTGGQSREVSCWKAPRELAICLTADLIKVEPGSPSEAPLLWELKAEAPRAILLA